jgi:hypothetical protein
MTRNDAGVCLALNGALLMLAGLFAGAAIPAVPYPRLMLAAHSAGFTSSGLISMVAGLLFKTNLCTVRPWAARVILWSHVRALAAQPFRSGGGVLGNEPGPADCRSSGRRSRRRPVAGNDRDCLSRDSGAWADGGVEPLGLGSLGRLQNGVRLAVRVVRVFGGVVGGRFAAEVDA